MSNLAARKERQGWRDQEISERHRAWGWNCPALDVDFLMLEYDNGKASAIVEYKNEHAMPQRSAHPSYRALTDLGNRSGLPVFAVRYASDFTWWRVYALNAEAGKYLNANPTLMSEADWVSLLYETRGMGLPEDVRETIENSDII